METNCDEFISCERLISLLNENSKKLLIIDFQSQPDSVPKIIKKSIKYSVHPDKINYILPEETKSLEDELYKIMSTQNEILIVLYGRTDAFLRLIICFIQIVIKNLYDVSITNKIQLKILEGQNLKYKNL
jgi:hypothetical protein